MTPLSFVLVARDKTPSQALLKLKDELVSRGNTVIPFLGDGEPLTNSLGAIKATVRKTDILL